MTAQIRREEHNPRTSILAGYWEPPSRSQPRVKSSARLKKINKNHNKQVAHGFAFVHGIPELFHCKSDISQRSDMYTVRLVLDVGCIGGVGGAFAIRNALRGVGLRPPLLSLLAPVALRGPAPPRPRDMSEDPGQSGATLLELAPAEEPERENSSPTFRYHHIIGFSVISARRFTEEDSIYKPAPFLAFSSPSLLFPFFFDTAVSARRCLAGRTGSILITR